MLNNNNLSNAHNFVDMPITSIGQSLALYSSSSVAPEFSGDEYEDVGLSKQCVSIEWGLR